MFKKVMILLLACSAGAACDAAQMQDWVPLLTSNDDLANNWRASENEGTFKFEDGMLVVHGRRSHLFYVGPVENHDFKNFEFQAEVKTTKGSNSGIYFHTAYQQDGWPSKGYECQVNTTHSDRKKTGGLYGIRDVIDDAPSTDGQWFHYYIKVEGKRIIVKIDGQTTVDYVEPKGWDRGGRRVCSGTFAIQGHDPKSVVYFRNIEVRPLPDAPGWIPLFDGQSLDGWKASENEDTFSVKDGEIVAHGPRSHLFYTGVVNNASFTDFEFMADVRTMPGSNSGIYFHTEYQPSGWPDKGYEVQVNNTHSDWRKTGGLYAVVDVKDPPAEDGEWFTEHIIVKGKEIEIRVNGKTTVKYTEPPEVAEKGHPRMPGRKVSSGTFALQGHDPKSIVHFRDLMVKPLDPIKVVVVTGGHGFEHAPFFAIFQGHPDIEYVEAEQKDHSELFEDIRGWDYDVIVLYNMSQKLTPQRQRNFATLVKERGVGLVALHHAEAAFNESEMYRELIGARYPLKDQEIEGKTYAKGTYKHDVDIAVHVADPDHPITCGMDDFEIHDETYHGVWIDEDNHVLLTTDHPTSDKTIGWTREAGDARVVMLQGGHDSKAYANPNYRKLVIRAIRWTAGRL